MAVATLQWPSFCRASHTFRLPRLTPAVDREYDTLLSCFPARFLGPLPALRSTIPFVSRSNPERAPYNVGKNLTYIRIKRGWTQEQAGELLGLTARSVQRIEGGQNMTILTVARIASAYGVQLHTLFMPAKMQLPRQPGRPRKRWVETVRKMKET